MFKIGDKIYLPSYGAGSVQDIDQKIISDIIREYIVVQLALDNMSLYIPIKEIKKYNVRYVVSAKEAEDTLNIIKERPNNIEKKWTKRYRINNEKLKNGNFKEECEVIRDLCYLKFINSMPPGELKILQLAEKMVVGELMMIYNISEKESYEILRKFENKL